MSEPAHYLPSPVPSDARLWPRELPFTAFGHLGEGMLDLRVFDQDTWWVNREGRPFLLEEMSGEYVANVISFLVEFREQYFADTIRRWFIQATGDRLLYGGPSGEALAAAVGGPAWSEMTAEDWLGSTPLMRRLRRLTLPACPSQGSMMAVTASATSAKYTTRDSQPLAWATQKPNPPTRAVVLDFDGVVSAVNPDPAHLPWGDERQVAWSFGPVLVSASLIERLDAIHRLPDVSCWWLTSWRSEVRSDLGLPGGDWPVVREPDPYWPAARKAWWKGDAVELWLDAYPEVRRVAWVDDHLRGGRLGAVRRRFAARGLDALLIAPATDVGLTPADVARLEAWCRGPKLAEASGP